MSKDSPQTILDELQTALQRLKSIPLPQETKFAKHQATRLLAELPRYLEENVEQTRLASRVAELETLTNIDQELNARLDLDHVTEITRRWAIRGTSATQGWVILVEEDHKSPRIASGPGEKANFMRDTLIAQTIEESKPRLIPPTDDTPARLFVPIPREGGSIGLIVAERSSDHPLPFTEADSQFLTRLNGRAAIAIENARLNEAVQQANQAKSKFFSVVTHELRISMTSIKGYADLLRQESIGPINEQQANFLNLIRKNVGRISTLVSDLSDISRIETGRLKLEADLFSQFFRSEQTTVREQQGWGLGLSVAKRLEELMNGKIGCEAHWA